MKNLYSLFEQLKKIEARPEYVRHSRELITGISGTPAIADRIFFYLREYSTLNFRAAFVGFLILIIGVFSLWQLLFPLTLTSLDPISIRAEAEAIDIQIQLTNLTYQESSLEKSTVPAPGIRPSSHLDQIRKEAEELGLTFRTLPSSTLPATSPQPLTIEEALEILSR